VVIHRCALLPVIKDFADEAARALATVRTTSMQGVGTKLGTVLSDDSKKIEARAPS